MDKNLTKNAESCIINDGKTTPYFKLERLIRQEDPISTCFFILALEVIFTLIKENPNIERLHFIVIAYSAYANDITFFLRNKKSALIL